LSDGLEPTRALKLPVTALRPGDTVRSYPAPSKRATVLPPPLAAKLDGTAGGFILYAFMTHANGLLTGDLSC